MKTIYCIGEALIDFTPIMQGTGFQKNPGGAPANVAATVAKMGGKSAMLTQVGNDAFGHYLGREMKKNLIDTQFLRYSDHHQTSLAFVDLNEAGERSFTFYRDNAADLMMHAQDYTFDMFQAQDILHFCSVNLGDYPSRETHRKAIELMKAKGGIISFDPNIRLALWKDPEKLYQTIHEFLPFADILKISDDELFFITKEKDETKALKSLLIHENSILIYTQGAKGIRYITKDHDISVQAMSVQVVDTTGAGDASIGSILTVLQAKNFKLSIEEIIDMLRHANKVAGLTCTKFGGMSSVPHLHEL